MALGRGRPLQGNIGSIHSPHLLLPNRCKARELDKSARIVRAVWPTDFRRTTGRLVIAQVRELVGEDQVLLGLSGGVDSSVVAALLHRAIGERFSSDAVLTPPRQGLVVPCVGFGAECVEKRAGFQCSWRNASQESPP